MRSQARRCSSARLTLGLSLIAAIALFSIPAQGAPGMPATQQTKVLYEPVGLSSQLIVHPSSPQTLYWAVMNRGVLKSADGGVTWTPKNFGLPNLAVRRIAMHPTDPNHLVVGFDNRGQGAWPYRSLDGGERWEPTVVCESEAQAVGLPNENLRQSAGCDGLVFDPVNPAYFYFMVESQQFSTQSSSSPDCGGFYRSCDAGASYDRNPLCIASPSGFLRPSCASGTPPPSATQNFKVNDATDAVVISAPGSPDHGMLHVFTSVHGFQNSLMSSGDQGLTLTYRDVVDTTGTFLDLPGDPTDAGPAGMFISSLALAPSNQQIRYAGLAEYDVLFSNPTSPRCSDGKAYPRVFGTQGCPTSRLPQKHSVVTWTGTEYSGGTECQGNNDCDGDASADRVWRPIVDFDTISPPTPTCDVGEIASILVHPNDPERLFAVYQRFSSNAFSGGELSLQCFSKLVMLKKAAAGQPWTATVLMNDQDAYFRGLVRDPGNPDAFYVTSSGKWTGGAGDLRYKTSGLKKVTLTNNFQTVNVSTLVSTKEFFNVYDLEASVDPQSGVHMIGVTSGSGLHLYNESAGTWTTVTGFADHEAGLSIAPFNPQLVTLKTPIAVGVSATGMGGLPSGFGDILSLPSNMLDMVKQRSQVVCTNVFNDMTFEPTLDGSGKAVLLAATSAGIWKHPDVRVPATVAERDTSSLQWQAFARASTGLSDGNPDEFVWSLAFDPIDPNNNTLIAGTRRGNTYDSFDHGQTWHLSPRDLSPPIQASLKDVRDFAFLGMRQFAATGAGVLRRDLEQPPYLAPTWVSSLATGPVSQVATGTDGSSRVYAAAGSALWRSRNSGTTWEALPLIPRAPYSAVLETKQRDGRRDLWVPDVQAGLYRISSTMTARPGCSLDSVVLKWTHSPNEPTPAGYELHYGSNPDSPSTVVQLGAVTTHVLTGLNLGSGPIYFALKARDGQGALGPLGLPLKVDRGFTFSPRPTAAPACPTGAKLTWLPVPGVQSYAVYRRIPGATFAPLITGLAPTSTSYTDGTAATGQAYEYYMTSTFSGSGETTGGPIVAITPADDPDNDSVGVCSDTCPAVYNSIQTDSDSDGLGDACDPCPGGSNVDTDLDGVMDGCDNCTALCNPLQENADADIHGDACDICPGSPDETDPDFDGIPSGCDNCPSVANPGQENGDGDSFGNVCDNCPTVSDPGQENSDGDTFGDVCDNCPLVTNQGQEDVDADVVGDVCDNCLTVSNPGQSNEDTDALGDACDNCDLVYNPFQENSDTDDDGDACDNCQFVNNSGQENNDGDVRGNACDNCPNVFQGVGQFNDSDGDGHGNVCDNCVNVPNGSQQNSDTDGFGDACDNCIMIANPAQNTILPAVIYPNGGQLLNINQTVTLLWSACSPQVDLKLSRNGVIGSYSTLYTNTPNDGQEPWTVTGPKTNGATAFLKVTEKPTPTTSGASDTSDSGFAIQKCGPCVVSYCGGPSSRCTFNNTCGVGACCNYTCNYDPTCTAPDPIPPGACS